MNGDSGQNQVTGSDSSNDLSGTAGSDAINAMAGNDVLDGGLGADTYDGGAGNDRYILADDAVDTLFFRTDDEQQDILDISNLLPSDANPGNISSYLKVNDKGVFLDSAGQGQFSTENQLARFAANNPPFNALIAVQIADTSVIQFDWTQTADIPLTDAPEGTVEPGSENNQVEGTAASELLVGTAAADTLKGEAGDDVLNGGAGADVYKGGTGNDRYVLDDTEAVDTLYFRSEHAQKDILDVSALLSGTDVTESNLKNYLKVTAEGIYLDAAGEGIFSEDDQVAKFAENNPRFDNLIRIQIADNLVVDFDWSATANIPLFLSEANLLQSLYKDTFQHPESDVMDRGFVRSTQGQLFKLELDNHDLTEAHGGYGDEELDASGVAGSGVAQIAHEADHKIHLYGREGADTLKGNEDGTYLDGGLGDDRIEAGQGRNFLVGGSGNDEFVLKMEASIGDDIKSDLLYDFSSNSDQRDGIDLSQILPAEVNADNIHSYVKVTADGIFVDLNGKAHFNSESSLARFGEKSDIDNLINIRLADGSGVLMNRDDALSTIQGEAESETLNAGDGSDTIYGNAGDDVLNGDALASYQSADHLYGGEGNDILHVDQLDANQGTVDGGAGYDQVKINGQTGENITLDLHEASIEKAFGGASDDVLDGSGFTDTSGGYNKSTKEYETAEAQRLDLFGRDGDDTLTGGVGRDYLDGGTGDDIISDGLGRDFINGGSGNDVFVIADDGELDTLWDFKSTTDQHDVIDISAFVTDNFDYNQLGSYFHIDTSYVYFDKTGQGTFTYNEAVVKMGSKVSLDEPVSVKWSDAEVSYDPDGGNITLINEAPVLTSQVPIDVMSAAYTFDDTSDATGNGNTLTLGGSATSGTGYDGTGTAFEMDGTAGSGEITGLETGGAMSVSTWVKFDSFDQNWSRIFDFGDGAGQNNILVGHVTTTNALGFHIMDGVGGPSTVKLEVSDFFTAGEWVHVTATIAEDGTMSIYKNGELAGQAEGAVPETMVRTHNYIGKSAWSQDGDLDGAIDEFAVYNTTLSAEQAKAVYESASIDNQLNESLQIAENSSDSTIVGTVAATDANSDTLTYSLTNDADGRFSINGSTGEIAVAKSTALDYEAAASHTITVQVTDGDLSDSGDYTVWLTDQQNVAPTAIALDSVTVPENSAGAVVGTLTTTDDDPNDSHTYTVSDDRFEVVNGQLKLKDGISLNYEVESSVTVAVTSTDTDSATKSESFTLSVTDINDAPTASDPTVTLQGTEDNVLIITKDQLRTGAEDDENDTISIENVSYSGTDGTLTEVFNMAFGSETANKIEVSEKLQSFDAFSLEFEYTSTGSHSGGIDTLFSMSAPGSGSGSDNALMLAINNSDNSLLFYVKGTSTTFTGINLNDGASHNIAFTWDNSTGDLKLFDNNQLLSTQTMAQGQTIPGDGWVILGQDQDNYGGGTDPSQSLTNAELGHITLSYDAISQSDIEAGVSVESASSSLALNLKSENGQIVDTANDYTITTAGSITQNHDHYEFTPGDNFNGNVVLDYELSDGTATTATQASLEIQATNDAAVTGDAIAYTTNEDTTITLTEAQLLANASDVDVNDTLSVSNLQVNGGSVSVTDNGDDSWSFTPAANWSGEATLSFDISDGTETISSQLNLTVSPEADAPILSVNGNVNSDLIINSNEDNPIALDVSGALADTDGSETLTVSLAGLPSGFTLTDGTNSLTTDGSDIDVTGWTLNSLMVTPPANHNTDVTLTLTATSTETGGNTTSQTQTILLDIQAINDAPIAADPTVTLQGTEANVLVITKDQLLARATDPENDPVSIGDVSYSGSDGVLADVSNLVFGSDGANKVEVSEKLQSFDAFSIAFEYTSTGSHSGGIDSLLSMATPQAGKDNALHISVVNSNGSMTVFVNGSNYVNFNEVDVNDGATHNITFIWDSATGDLKLFDNNQLLATKTVAQGQTIAADGWLMLGQEQDSYGGGLDSSQSMTNAELGHFTLSYDAVSQSDIEAGISVVNASSNLALNVQAANSQVVDSANGYTLTTAGSVSSGEHDHYEFTPDGNFNGTIALDYELSDGTDTTATQASLEFRDESQGTTGDDVLSGSTLSNSLQGLDGNDTISGGTGSDLINGGAGNDILSGDDGSDIFTWTTGDMGTAAAPAEDVITDFNIGSGGDVLDLSDVLVNESEPLDSYLSLNFENGDTTIDVKPAGDSDITQKIKLEGVDLSTYGGGTTDVEILNNLIDDGHLQID